MKSRLVVKRSVRRSLGRWSVPAKGKESNHRSKRTASRTADPHNGRQLLPFAALHEPCFGPNYADQGNGHGSEPVETQGLLIAFQGYLAILARVAMRDWPQGAHRLQMSIGQHG